ncbi:hypothetical protein [Alteribacter aurantiacus]|uniref:hypothetical protein n=1 Tax=Alteribacter aurantiacus TaxID=254410 RepID=UPI000407DFD8|nr:hypothetical protein [Alteribacter aurantiacus]
MKLSAILEGTDQSIIQAIDNKRRMLNLSSILNADARETLNVKNSLTSREKKMLDYLLCASPKGYESSVRRSYLDELACLALCERGIAFSITYDNQHEYVIPREWKQVFLGPDECSNEQGSGLFFWQSLLTIHHLHRRGGVRVKRNDHMLYKWVIKALKNLRCIESDKWVYERFHAYLQKRFDDVLEEVARLALGEKVKDCSAFIHGAVVTGDFPEELIEAGIVVSSKEGWVFGANLNNIASDGMNVMMDLGNYEIIVPQTVSPPIIWELLEWGRAEENKEAFITGVAHVTFTKETVKEAELLHSDMDAFLKRFKDTFLDGDRYAKQFSRWIGNREPISRGGAYERFDIMEEEMLEPSLTLLQENQIDYIHSATSILVSQQNVDATLKVFRKAGMIPDLLSAQDHKKTLSTNNETWKTVPFNQIDHPYCEEITRLPRQWFSLLSYDDTTLLRMIRQANVMNIPLKVELQERTEKVIEVASIHVKGETYPYLKTLEGAIIQLDHVMKIALINPVDLRMERGAQ